MNESNVNNPQSANSAEPVVAPPHLPQGASSSGEGRSGIGSIVRNIHTLVILAILAGLGFWGHQTGWSMPSFAELRGRSGGDRDDWCAEHGVPESECVECDPERFPKLTDHGWCETHGVHQCPFEHPDVIQVKAPIQGDPEAGNRASTALALRLRPQNNQSCASYRRRIQFASHECVLKLGIDVEPVELGPVTEVVSATGEVRYDATRVAQLSTKAAGTAWRVDKQLGDNVHQGDVLALVDAAEVGRLKSELLVALADANLREGALRRTEGLAAQGITASRQRQEAEAEWSKAKTRLLAAEQALNNLGLPASRESLRGLSEDELAAQIRLLGLPTAAVRQLESSTTTSNLIAVTSPLSGVVVAREIVAGEVVDTTRVLFRVADTSRLWLLLNVPIEDASLVRTGQQVKFLPDGTAEEVTGVVTWVSTAVDSGTRTVRVRADVANEDGRLRAETFGTGRIVLREESAAVLVPNDAVQWDGSCNIVFVRDKNYFKDGAPKIFHTRSVRVGVKSKGVTEIIAGVVPTEIVATKGSGVLRAQLLKNSLGAG